MKTKTLILAACMAMMMGAANAQTPADDAGKYRSADLNKAEKNYVACLRSGNEGAMESALGQIARMQLSVTDVRFSALTKEVAKLTADDQPERIRYKAYLVENLCGNPALFAAEGAKKYNDTDEMFSAIATRLQETYLTMNTGR